MALEPSHPEHSCSLSSLFSELCQEHSCAICGQVMIDPRVLDCQHSFCFRCLFRLNLRNRESDITIYCPFKCGNVTRLHGTLHALPRNYTLSNTCSLLRDHSRRGKTDHPEDSSGVSLPCEWCSDSSDEGTCVFCSTCRSWLCSKCNNRCGDHAYLCKYADASSIHSADKIMDVIPFLFPESAARKVIQQQSKFYGISDRDGHANVGIFPARLQCTEGHFTAMSVDDTSVSLRLAQPFSFSKEDFPLNFRSHRRLGDDGTYPLMILAYAIKTCEKLHRIVDVLESGFVAIKRHSGDSPCCLGMKEALCCAVAAFRLHALMVIIRQQYLPLLELLLMIEFHISETTIQRLNYKYAHVITPAERKAVREHSLHFSQTHYTIALSMKEAVTGAAQDVETLHQILNWLMSSQDGSNDDDDEGPCDGEVRLAAMKKFDDAVSAAIDRVVADTAQLCRRVQSFRLYAFAEGDLPMERMEAMEVWADDGRRQTVRFLEELTNGLHDWDSYFTTALSLSPSDARRRIQHAVQAVLRPTSTETPFSVDECDVVEWFQLIVVRRQLVQVGLMGDAHFSVSRDLHFHDSWLRSMQQLWEGLCHALQSSTIRMPKAPRWEKGMPLEEDTNRNSSSNSSGKVVAVESTDHSSEKCTYYHTEVDAVNLLLAQQNILSQLKRSTTYSLDMEMRQLLHDPLDVAAPSAEAASNAPLNVQIIDAIMATSRIMSNQTDPDARSDGAHVPTIYLEEDDGTLFVMAQRHFRDLFESSPKELMQTIRKHVSIPVYIGVVSAQKKSAVFIFDAQTARTTLQVGSLPPPISLAMILESPLMKVGVSVAIVISAVWGLVRL